MSTKCSGCAKPIQSLNFLECSSCQETYDLLCLGMEGETFAHMAQDAKDCWLCPLCTSNRPKRDNTHTPIGSPIGTLNSTYTASDAGNTTLDRVNSLRGTRRPPLTPAMICTSSDSENIAQLVSEMKCLREESQEQNKSLSLLRQDVRSLKDQLLTVEQTFKSKVESLEKKVDSQDSELALLKGTITSLQVLLNTQEQTNLRNKLEISGVPEAKSENLQQVALITAARIGVELTAADIDCVMRAGPKRSPVVPNSDVMPRPIVVKLLRRSKRDEIIQAAKSRRNLTSEIVAQGTSKKLYINERLTKSNRALFKEARLRTQQHNFRFCWVRNESIYVRQSEKKQAFIIQALDDLDQRVGPAKADGTKASAKAS